jgi:hypothetical protein
MSLSVSFSVLSFVTSQLNLYPLISVNLNYSGIIINSCKNVAQSLLQSLNSAAKTSAARGPNPAIIQPSHVLQSLKALCCGIREISDTDLELLESHLKELIVKREPGNLLFFLSLDL